MFLASSVERFKCNYDIKLNGFDKPNFITVQPKTYYYILFKKKNQ